VWWRRGRSKGFDTISINLGRLSINGKNSGVVNRGDKLILARMRKLEFSSRDVR
jgi:hypothetical protein